MKGSTNPDLMRKARRIRFLLLDVDGVMTDGLIYLNSKGEETKGFHIQDGAGITRAQKAGISIGIVTGRSSGVVSARARELKIEEVHQGVEEKIGVYELLLEKYGLTDTEMAYVGDDVIDLPVLKRVGLAVAVADAHPRVKQVAHWITEKGGGKGAVREVTDLLLAAQSRP